MPSSPAVVLHGPCGDPDPVRGFRPNALGDTVLSVRAVYDAHVGRDGRNVVNRELCWRYGRAERLRRAVIVAVARGWSMACYVVYRVRKSL